MASKPVQRPTPEGFTPPDYKVEYVAYNAAAYRTGNPETGEATDFRSSVFVTEYPEVKVATIERKTKQSRGEEFAYGYVTFDAASLNIDGLTKNFGGSVQADSPAFDLLEEAHRRGAPVYAARETVRKQNGADGKIDPTAYIHDLRGAQKDGTKGDVGATGQNCFNVISAVGAAGDPSSIVFTGDLRSDPAEWASLRRNRDHTLPPSGWRISQGGITPADSGTGGSVDVAALADAVAQRLRPQSAPAAPAPNGQPVRSAHASEGKPWEPLNSDNRVNLSSWIVAKERYTLTTACDLLVEHTTPASDPQAFLADAWSLTDLLLWMADAVQSNVTGARPNRADGSHKEAARWCSIAYNTLPGTPAGDGLSFPATGVTDRKAAEVWARQVIEVATGLFTSAAQRVERYVKGDPAPAQQQPHTQQQSQQQPAAAEAPASGSSAADDDSLVAEWNDLLAQIGQAEHPERFGPVLSATFGEAMLSQIDAGAFRERLSQWKADPRGFEETAVAAFRGHMNATAPQPPTGGPA